MAGFPPKKPAPATSPEMDAVGALMAGPDDEAAEGEAPAKPGNPAAVLDNIAAQLQELRTLIAG